MKTHSFHPSSFDRSASTSSTSGKVSLRSFDVSLVELRTVPRTRYFCSATRPATTCEATKPDAPVTSTRGNSSFIARHSRIAFDLREYRVLSSSKWLRSSSSGRLPRIAARSKNAFYSLDREWSRFLSIFLALRSSREAKRRGEHTNGSKTGSRKSKKRTFSTPSSFSKLPRSPGKGFRRFVIFSLCPAMAIDVRLSQEHNFRYLKLNMRRCIWSRAADMRYMIICLILRQCEHIE